MKKGLAQEGSQAPCTKWAWALLAAVLLFIWGNSLLPPSWSWRVSGVVHEAVEQVLPVEQADGVLGQVKGFTVRKLASAESCPLPYSLRMETSFLPRTLS